MRIFAYYSLFFLAKYVRRHQSIDACSINVEEMTPKKWRTIDMGLTRSMLNGMGLTPDQISAVIEAHTETTDALKEQRDSYKADSERIADLEKKLAEAEKKLANADGEEGWKAKYEEEHKAFESYKTEQKEAEVLTAKKSAYREALKDAGVSEKAIDLILDSQKAQEAIKALEISEDGKVKTDGLSEGFKSEYAGFITSADTSGAKTDTPPAGSGGEITKEQFASMSYSERAKLFSENRELYDQLKGE